MAVGILPASGSASRLNGLPKFILPVADGRSLLQWHVDLMSRACRHVTVSTRNRWTALVRDLSLNAYITEREPSTMADAVLKMTMGESDAIVIGMPDIYIHNSLSNFYEDLLTSDGDIVLATWDYAPQNMRGKIGQVLADDKGNVLSVVDKDPDCDYPEMWGALLFRNESIKKIDPEGGSVLNKVNDWIAEGVSVKRVKMSGEYIDAGTVEGLVQLYTAIGKSL
jgi:hypothetical protein